MFCLCVYEVPCEEETPVRLPEGLILVGNFVSQEEEELLLTGIDWSPANDDVTGEGLLSVFLSFCAQVLILVELPH